MSEGQISAHHVVSCVAYTEEATQIKVRASNDTGTATDINTNTDTCMPSCTFSTQMSAHKQTGICARARGRRGEREWVNEGVSAG